MRRSCRDKTTNYSLTHKGIYTNNCKYIATLLII